MIKIYDFNTVPTSGITYGGHSGSKKGILLDNERWFLKYPKSTRSMEVIGLSYTTSPLSEYIGSHIYSLIGLDTHETKLGIANDKVVVACKDFLNENETILDYNAIKNDYDELVEKELERLSSSSQHMGTDINEIIIVMNSNYYFKRVPELKTKFWDMFIVDAFISNNDRNDNNWGLIINHSTLDIRLAPIYDNGASFYSKSSSEKLSGLLKDEHKMKQAFYDSSISSFSLDGKKINPLKYIESMNNEDCNNALLRIFPKIDLDKIKTLFNDIPEEYNGYIVFNKEQKDFYYRSLVYKYDNVLKPIYNKLKE